MLVDSDVLIDVLRGHEPAIDWFAGLSDVPKVPGFVVMELVQSAPDKARLRQAKRLVDPLDRVWPSTLDCERALADFERFHLSHGIGLLDALIGSIAIGLGDVLCTFNAKHYRVLAGLEILKPYAR